MGKPFDYRDLDSIIANSPPEPTPINMATDPAETLRLNYQHAVEMRVFYRNAGPAHSPLAAAHWSGQAMAYALLLRDHYDYAEGERLVNQIGMDE